MEQSNLHCIIFVICTTKHRFTYFINTAVLNVGLSQMFSKYSSITNLNTINYLYLSFTFRSSRPEVFFEKGVLRNFAKFTGKNLCQSLFFNKVADAACNFIQTETLAQVFSCEFCEISKNASFYRTPLVAASVRL